MNRRNLRLSKYGITSKRYKELCGFCEQYPEWVEELSKNEITVKSPSYDGMPFQVTNTITDSTADMAMRRANFDSKVSLVENVAKEAADDLWEYVILSVCYQKPFWYLRDIEMMPCSERSFYDKRRYFFFLLDKRKM